MHLKCVSEGIYTWSFQDRIAIRSEKMHEVTRCKQPYREEGELPLLIKKQRDYHGQSLLQDVSGSV